MKKILLMFLILAVVFSSQVNARTIAWCHKDLAEDLQNTFGIHCDVLFPFQYDLGNLDEDELDEFGGFCAIDDYCSFPVESGIYCGDSPCKFRSPNHAAHYWIPVSTLEEYQTGTVASKKITNFQVYAADFVKVIEFNAYKDVTWKTIHQINEENDPLLDNAHANNEYVTFPYIPIIDTTTRWDTWKKYFNNKATRVFHRGRYSDPRLNESYEVVRTNNDLKLYKWEFSNHFDAEVFALNHIHQEFAIVMTIDDGTSDNDDNDNNQYCSDGTPYGECNDQGQKCIDGNLVEDTTCGTSNGETPSSSACVPADYMFTSNNLNNFQDNLINHDGSEAVLDIDENEAKDSGASLSFTKQRQQGISYLLFPVDVEQGEKYVVSAWIKTSKKNFARLFATNDANTMDPLPGTESIHKGDGTWKHLFYTFTASGDYIHDDNGPKHYIVVSAGSPQNTDVGGLYLYELDIRKISSDCNLQTCKIDNLLISDDCSSDGCRKGNNITISAEYSGACSNKMFVQIDAKSSDDKCDIQHENINNVQGFISGMDFACDQSPCTATWQFPDIPDDCYAKTVDVEAVGLWEGAVSDGLYHSWYDITQQFFIAPECTATETKCSDDGKEIVSCSNGRWDYDNTVSCTENETCYEGQCIPIKCVDGTEPGECSTHNKGKMCVDTENGLQLLDNFTCGCPDGYYPDYSEEECKPAKDICTSEGVGFVQPDSAKKAECENTNGTYKPIYTEISLGDVKVNCTTNYTCECSEGSVLLDDECVSTCNHDNICDMRVERLLSCMDDCTTTWEITFGGETKTNGYKFIANSHGVPQKMWACNYGYDFSVCKSACEAGNKGIDSPCICSYSLGECSAECYDKTGDAYIVLTDPDGKTFIKKITYTCPQYGVDNLQEYLDYFTGLHADLYETLNEYIELIEKDPNNPENRDYENNIQRINEALLVLEPVIPYLRDVIQHPTYTTTKQAHIRVNQTIERLNEILRQGLVSAYRIEEAKFDKILPMYSNADLELKYMTMAPSSRTNETRWTYIKCHVIDPSGNEQEVNTSCESITRTSIKNEKTAHAQLYLDKKGNWTIESCELYVSLYDDCSYSINYHTKQNIGSIYATYVPLITIKDIDCPSSALLDDKINISIGVENSKQTPASMKINCTIKDPEDTKYIMNTVQQIPANSTLHVNLTKTLNKKGRWVLEGCSLFYINGSFEHSKSINKNIDVSLPDFVLEPLFLTGSVRPGDEIKYDLTLNNTGRTTNFTFSLSSSKDWSSQFLVNDEEKNHTQLQKNEEALIKVYVRHINATHNSTIKFSVKSLEGLEKTATIKTFINTTNNPPNVDVDDVDEVSENEDITFVADINDIDGDDIVDAKVCQDPECYNVYCELEKNGDEYTCTYNNNLAVENEYEYYVVARDAKGAETITDMYRFYVSTQPAETCSNVSCPGTDSECYCLDGECKPCPIGYQCSNNQCMAPLQPQCGDGFCDQGEDCPEDCGYSIDFTMLIIIFIIVLIAGGIYYYKVHGESNESIFR